MNCKQSDVARSNVAAPFAPKRTRRLLITLALAQASLVSVTAHAADPTWAEVHKAGELRCGAAVSAPVVLRDVRTGEYSGPFYDVCKKFAEQLKVKPVFVDTTWDNIVAGVQTGKWDIALALNKTPEREQTVTFSAPVIQSSTTLFYNKGNPKIPKGAATIAAIDKPNVTIAAIQGTANEKAITALVKNAQILRLPDPDAARLALISHRVDMLVDASDSNAVFLAAHKDWGAVLNTNPPIAPQDMAFGLSKSIPATDLAEFNQLIEREKKSGAVARSFQAAATASAKEAK